MGHSAVPGRDLYPDPGVQGPRRFGELDETSISLYSGGMMVRDLAYHLEATVGAELSHDAISAITNAVMDEMVAWADPDLRRVEPSLV